MGNGTPNLIVLKVGFPKEMAMIGAARAGVKNMLAAKQILAVGNSMIDDVRNRMQGVMWSGVGKWDVC